MIGGSVRNTLAFAVTAVLLTASAGTKASEDAHGLFESRCALCHGDHAGAFARQSLYLAEDGPRGRSSGSSVEAFLPSHAGGHSAEVVTKLTEMFRHQLAAGGVYERRCRICHDKARDLARGELIVIDARLVGRYTGRDIRSFLDAHGRLEPTEVTPLYELLRWQVESATED